MYIMAETKVPLVGFVGPSNVESAQRFDCQRTINFYIEINPLGQGKEQQTAVLLPTPGLKLRNTLSGGTIRGMHTSTLGTNSYAVAGNKLYVSTDNFRTSTLIGTLGTTTGPVSFADNGSAAATPSVMLIDGTNGYTFSIQNPVTTFAQITDPHFSAATSITFQDGYFILNKAGTGYFFISNLNDITFPDLNLALKSGYSDNIVGVMSNNRELYLFGTRTLEYWYDSGASGITPFARIDGKFSNVGCASPATVVKLSDTVFWLGPNEQGGGIVYMMKGNPQRISNHTIELALQSVSAENLSNSVAWAYQTSGHYFYALQVPGLNTTYVFDVSSGLWSERQSRINNKDTQHLAYCTTFNNNETLVGSRLDGNIYVFDSNYFYDDISSTEKAQILRKRISPHVSSLLNNCFITMLQIDAQAGEGTQTGTDAAQNPQLTLRVSRNGGKTYGQALKASIGKIGEYTTRQRWNRLGYGRDLIFEVSTTDPVYVAILSAWLSMNVGNS